MRIRYWSSDVFSSDLPALLRRIANAVHEIASHGYDHRRVFTFTPEEFRQDLKISRDLIQQASGKPVIGYRAPSFSIDARTPWAHPILVDEGYAYSRSAERRVGKECVSTCRSRWSPYN